MNDYEAIDNYLVNEYANIDNYLVNEYAAIDMIDELVCSDR